MVAALPLGPISRLARTGLALYASAVLATALNASRQSSSSDTGVLAVVLPIMHYAHGIGFLEGLARFRMSPTALLGPLAGIPPRQAPGEHESAFNPSLSAA